MTSHHFQHPTAVIASLVATLACCGLTACGSSTNTASQARTLTPQEAAIRHKAITEMVNCARRHGIHLPPPTAAGVNVSGVKGRRNEQAMSVCYHQALKKAGVQTSPEQESHTEQESRTEREAAQAEEPPPG